MTTRVTVLNHGNKDVKLSSGQTLKPGEFTELSVWHEQPVTLTEVKQDEAKRSET